MAHDANIGRRCLRAVQILLRPRATRPTHREIEFIRALSCDEQRHVFWHDPDTGAEYTLYMGANGGASRAKITDSFPLRKFVCGGVKLVPGEGWAIWYPSLSLANSGRPYDPASPYCQYFGVPQEERRRGFQQ